MRILVCNWRDTAHPAHGGAEVYTHEVLRRWAAGGHRVTLFSAAVAGRPKRELIDGVEHLRDGSRLGVYRAARRWWEDAGRRRGYDLVIDEVNTRPFGCDRWPGAAPVVALVHQVAREVWFSEYPLPLAAAGRFVLEPRWLRSLRYVPTLTVSESSRRSLVDAGIQRVALVPEGVDEGPAPLRPKETRPTAVFVGRLAANKRPDHAAVAVGLARTAIPDLRLWIVGDGPMRAHLADRPGVVLHGRVDETTKRSLVARAHVLVATSVREGWGLVVDEAARLGTPAIAYDVAGLRDSVRAAHGVVVEPRPEALAEALVARIPELASAGRPRQGWAGGAVGWQQVADEVLHRALEIVGSRAGGRPDPAVDLRDELDRLHTIHAGARTRTG
jgi:glycosyltransferase involved in cell wall biosynthesis